MLIWNCRGAFNPNCFCLISDLIRKHLLAILVIMETKVSRDRTRSIVNRLPMDGAILVNNIRLTGSLWVLWDSTQVDVFVLSTTEQEVHVLVNLNSPDSQGPWLLSTVYASPRLAERHLLWDNLSTMARLHNLPWVIAGDFNEVLTGSDKFGGRSVNINQALRFQECLDICKMIDIGFSGVRYTWSNNRPFSQLVQERIDRYFVNVDWYALFPEVSVEHLERGHSDHCPVKPHLDKPYGHRQVRPFRFRPIWLSHFSFPNIMRDAGQILVPYRMLSPGSLIKQRFGIGMCLATCSIEKSAFSPNLGVPKLLSPITPIIF